MDNHELNVTAASFGIGKLALALSMAQAEIQGATKDAENPAFKKGEVVSKYADLEAVWNACRVALSKNKLAILQTTHKVGDDWVLRTTLAHESGQTMCGDFPVKPLKSDMQGFMGAVTYARRGGLAAMVGVAPKGEDDDGNAASQSNGTTKDKSPPPQLKEATNGKAKAWVDGEIKKIDAFSLIAEIDLWKEDNAKALAKLSTTATEEYNRVKSFIHQKLEALGGNVEDGI